MTELEWMTANPWPASLDDDVVSWLSDRVEMGAAFDDEWLLADAPAPVREWLTMRRQWLAARDTASASWPVHRHGDRPMARFYGGEWIPSYAAVIGEFEGTRQLYGYVGAMLAMQERGAPEQDMRAMAARIYAHEAQMAALTQEMAEDLRRAAGTEGDKR